MKASKIILITFLFFLITGCNSDSTKENSLASEFKPNNEVQQQQNLADKLASIPIEDLMYVEEQAILFMREEEKLARDAYNLFYELWEQKIFSNIASAEKTHMDAMLLLIDRYQLTDPIGDDDEMGIFEDSELQNLYDILTTMGEYSMVDALSVGAEIEEVDLLDLEIRYQQSDNQDIHFMFDELMKGSRNHLRSFVSNLEKQGVIYEPRHLTQEAYDAIINTPMEKG